MNTEWIGKVHTHTHTNVNRGLEEDTRVWWKKRVLIKSLWPNRVNTHHSQSIMIWSQLDNCLLLHLFGLSQWAPFNTQCPTRNMGESANTVEYPQLVYIAHTIFLGYHQFGFRGERSRKKKVEYSGHQWKRQPMRL